MRKLVSFLFMSLDGVVGEPYQFVRSDVLADFPELIGETIAEQDAVLLGRKTYEEWASFWPTSQLQPFAPFINEVQKFVVSRTLREVGWHRSTLIGSDLVAEVTALKSSPGKTIGVHGSVSLTQSLLAAGLLDELRFIQVPALAGDGLRLLQADGPAIQLDLQASRATPAGLQFLAYRPRG